MQFTIAEQRSIERMYLKGCDTRRRDEEGLWEHLESK